MDLSKLPKMSQTPAPPQENSDASQADAAAARDRVMGYAQPSLPSSPEMGAEIWVSLILGIVFLFLGQTFGKWAIAKMSGQPFPTGIVWSPGAPKAGQPVEYFELQGGTAWGEMGFFALGAALVIDAGILALVTFGRRGYRLIYLAIFAAALGALINAVAIVKIMQDGITPLISILALGVGGLMIFWHIGYIRLAAAYAHARVNK